MADMMPKKSYDLTKITRLLLEMRENCIPKAGNAYEDPNRAEKYDALNAAIDLINNPSMMTRWISVKDRLPTGEDPVLILVKETEHYGYNKEKRKVYYCQYLAYWDGDEWFTTWCNGCRKISDTAKEPYADDYEVTHWMPLPKPPKE